MSKGSIPWGCHYIFSKPTRCVSCFYLARAVFSSNTGACLHLPAEALPLDLSRSGASQSVLSLLQGPSPSSW